MTTPAQRLGRWGERLAAVYLEQRGYTILAYNARTPYGELDLVARQDGVTVFVEVKTRRSTAFGLPETAITPTKQAHLLSAAQSYLQTHPDLEGDWRVDVIAICRLAAANAEPEIVHFENAFAGL
jgi:putative endonuclease